MARNASALSLDRILLAALVVGGAWWLVRRATSSPAVTRAPTIYDDQGRPIPPIPPID